MKNTEIPAHQDGDQIDPFHMPPRRGLFKVYASLKEIPKLPETAYVLTNKENTRQAVKELKANGIKRILFQSKKSVDQETLDGCRSAGIETAVACPLMFLGSCIHKIHGFFAGV